MSERLGSHYNCLREESYGFTFQVDIHVNVRCRAWLHVERNPSSLMSCECVQT